MIKTLNHTYILYVLVVDINSFICKQPFFANKKLTFANLSFVFRGVAAIHFGAVETQSNSMQTVPVWAIRETAKGRCKAILGKFHKEIIIVYHIHLTCRCKGAVWATGFYGHLLLRHCFRGTFARLSQKKPLQINRKIRTLNRGWGFSSTWLHYSVWVYSLLSNNNSDGSHFT